MDSSDNLFDYFELSKIQIWIEENGYKRVALQFPPDLLVYAPEITLELEKRLMDTNKFFILGDTSYRSCCANEIAANQANCDSIVQFGDSCLSQPNGNIPLLHIFGKKKVDIKKLKEEIKNLFASTNFEDNTILVLCDSNYSSLENDFEYAINSAIPSTVSIRVHICKKSDCLDASNELILGRELPLNYQRTGRENDLLIFIGADESPLFTIFRLTIQNIRKIFYFNPEQNEAKYFEYPINKLLMKRLYLVEKMRDAHTIGLIVGSATLHSCNEAISRIRQLCKQTNKKLYIFYIGKLNEAKLTNFGMDVDIFIMLSCPYGILIDEKKFYKPVISMIEAEMALNQNEDDCYNDVRWTAEYNKILERDVRHIENDMAKFSLTSGLIRSQEKSTDKGNDKQMVEYSAGDYFAQRTWRGLEETKKIEEHTTKLKEGRNGIASCYIEEPK